MAVSGIKIEDKLIEQYTFLQGKKEPHWCLLVMKFNDDQDEVILKDEISKKWTEYESYTDDEKYKQIKAYILSLADLNECFYMVVDSLLKKPGFFTWAPDAANVKKKMLISSTTDSVKKKLKGLSDHKLHCADLKDLDEKIDDFFQKK